MRRKGKARDKNKEKWYSCRHRCAFAYFPCNVHSICKRQQLFISYYFAQPYLYRLFSAWCLSIRKRIIQTQVRHYLTVISVLMIVWLLFRTVKFCISRGDVARHLWYLYYIPMLFIPLFSLFVANSLGKPENFKLPGWMRFLYIPTALLFLLVITNDLHQFVFSFP